MNRRPRKSTLFPYTTLFRSSVIRGMSIEARKHGAVNLAQGMPDFPAPAELKAAACRAIEADINQYAITWGAGKSGIRSEEHTSELQSHSDLVCRLLLEIKKI